MNKYGVMEYGVMEYGVMFIMGIENTCPSNCDLNHSRVREVPRDSALFSAHCRL